MMNKLFDTSLSLPFTTLQYLHGSENVPLNVEYFCLYPSFPFLTEETSATEMSREQISENVNVCSRRLQTIGN